MRSARSILAFAVAVVAVFLLAMGAGRAVRDDEPEAGAGYELVLEEEDFSPGKRELAFQVRRDGEAVTSYETAHEKLLHLIAVRDDFTGFQHLHPTLSADGTWRTPVALEAGETKLYADFIPTGADPQVLTTTVDVEGAVVQLPTEEQDSRVDLVDGYVVELRGDLVPGGASTLEPVVSRDSTTIADLQPYLGAKGHLVVIRHGSYDYLHVHPEGMQFHTTVEEPGTYELFLQFRHEGKVHTAQFRLGTGGGAPEGTGDEHGH